MDFEEAAKVCNIESKVEFIKQKILEVVPEGWGHTEAEYVKPVCYSDKHQYLFNIVHLSMCGKSIFVRISFKFTSWCTPPIDLYSISVTPKPPALEVISNSGSVELKPPAAHSGYSKSMYPYANMTTYIDLAELSGERFQMFLSNVAETLSVYHSAFDSWVQRNKHRQETLINDFAVWKKMALKFGATKGQSITVPVTKTSNMVIVRHPDTGKITASFDGTAKGIASLVKAFADKLPSKGKLIDQCVNIFEDGDLVELC